MNKAILMGNVGRDPRIRYVGDKPMAEFPLATSERQGTAERTEWHNIVMWGDQAEFAQNYIRKGTKLLIEGKIRTRYWEDRTAIKHTITEIYTETFEILGRTTG